MALRCAVVLASTNSSSQRMGPLVVNFLRTRLEDEQRTAFLAGRSVSRAVRWFGPGTGNSFETERRLLRPKIPPIIQTDEAESNSAREVLELQTCPEGNLLEG